MRRFFKDYQCSSPYFIDISQQFVDFVNQEYLPGPSDPDFLKALFICGIELDVSVDSGEVNVGTGKSADRVPTFVRRIGSRLVYCNMYPVHQFSYIINLASLVKLVHVT